MTTTMDGRPKRSDATRSLIQRKALEQGTQRSDELKGRVRDAMKTIEAEIAGNGRVYPYNHGAVSITEVARRAGVHPTTFYGPKQRELGEEVRGWLARLREPEPVGHGPARKKLVTRISDWKQDFENLQQSSRDTELELQQVKAELLESHKTIAMLKEENSKLLNIIKKGNFDNVRALNLNKS